MKIAKVVPIFKSGDKLLPDNYRPISLLPNFSKILEKLIANRLSNFLESNNYLSKNQYGFRKNHSTVHPLIHFMNHLTKSLNKKFYTIAIFCDLCKAFDTVDHNILLKKLFNIGVRGIELTWFRNYLSNRKQYVSIDGVNSQLLEIVLGVPQGSILGPLLFLIYINDIDQCTSMINFLFADDTTLLKSHENLTSLCQIVNDEFHKIVNFFNSHRLSLHPDKTKFILFCHNKIHNIPDIFINFNKLNSNPLNYMYPVLKMSCVNTSPQPYIKFLGVFFDPNLNFKQHISYISNKLSKALYFLRSTKNILNERSLKFIYYSLFHSNLIYAIHVWSCTSSNNFKPLILKQKAAVRIIGKASYNSHTEPIFKNLKILPFFNLIDFFKIQFMQRFVQNFLPISFNEVWITNRIRRQDQDHVELRDDDRLHIPFMRTRNLDLHPLVSFPKIWEDFPDENIKFVRNIPEFNFKLKSYFLSNLQSAVTCTRLFCPSCNQI